MAEEKQQDRQQEPRGFGEHVRGLAGEYAHEQGWGLNEEERVHRTGARQPEFGGKDYEYGARDFGDEPTTPSAIDESEPSKTQTQRQDTAAE